MRYAIRASPAPQARLGIGRSNLQQPPVAGGGLREAHLSGAPVGQQSQEAGRLAARKYLALADDDDDDGSDVSNDGF